MTFETSLIFAISLILLWIKPGPGQAFIITRALNDGFFAAFYVVLGITSGAAIFFLIAILGLDIFASFFDKASFFLKLIGAFYLLYMGIDGLRNINSGLWKGRLDKSNKAKFIQNFPAALLLTLANPFVIFYFIGILPGIVTLEDLTLQDILIGLSLVIAVGLIVDTLIALLVSQVKDLLSDMKLVKKLNLITSISFILIGLFFIYSAVFMSNYSYSLV
jgi:threonine/homoserine/homoserine lactone efflux protein